MNEYMYVAASIRERIALSEFKQERNDFEITQTSCPTDNKKWDAVIVSGASEMLLEIKIRDWSVNDFTSWLIEEKKYNAIMDICNRMNREIEPFYVCILQDGVLFFNLKTVNLDFKNRDTKKSVMVDRGREDKRVAFIPTNQGTFYQHNIDFNFLNKKTEEEFKQNFPDKQTPKLFRNATRLH